MNGVSIRCFGLSTLFLTREFLFDRAADTGFTVLITTIEDGASRTIAMLLHKSPAYLTMFLLGFIPRRIVAVRIVIATIERAPSPALALYNFTAAFGARYACITQ